MILLVSIGYDCWFIVCYALLVLLIDIGIILLLQLVTIGCSYWFYCWLLLLVVIGYSCWLLLVLLIGLLVVIRVGYYVVISGYYYWFLLVDLVD